ncbi:hypothetical protein ACF0H5_020357 [Mactra antiquata]
MFVKIVIVVLCAGLACSCNVSLDCKDSEGRSLCYEKTCRRDVPCNKDNDCFFYGAADVSQGYPQLRCYKNPRVNNAPGYGSCMNTEYAGGLERVPGSDVVDVQSERSFDSMTDLLKILKSNE